VGVTTVTAGVLSIRKIFWPLTSKPSRIFTGYLDAILMEISIAGVILVIRDAGWRWIAVLNGGAPPAEAFGGFESAHELKMSCC